MNQGEAGAAPGANGLIRARRDDLGLTQAEFADMLGVTPQTISNWERGAADPTRDRNVHRREQNLAALREAGVNLPGNNNHHVAEEAPSVSELLERLRLLLEQFESRVAAPEATAELEAKRRGDPPALPRANTSGRRDAPS